jgi:hypothetical protein
MVELIVKLVNELAKIQTAAEKAAFKNLGHAAAAIRKDAIASIHFGEGPSKPGSPPNTHGPSKTKKGKDRKGQLQRAIVYDVGPDSALIGPRFSVVGTSGAAHEFGGQYKQDNYPERPFMGPALIRNIDRFASDWAGSIGE